MNRRDFLKGVIGARLAPILKPFVPTPARPWFLPPGLVLPAMRAPVIRQWVVGAGDKTAEGGLGIYAGLFK